MTLTVDVTTTVGTFTLDARFTAGGRVTALFGRSGAGKTTLVNVIAGLLRPRRGVVAVDGAVLTDTNHGIAVPPHRRGIGYVFQEGRLFPHMSVRGNLMYGRRFAGRGRAGPPLSDIAGLLGIAGLLDRRPADLSGGEKQRVAIGRALLANPRLLLMDEPLAALDRERRDEILPYIERLRDEMRVPIVYVSHAVDEVVRLADTVVVLAGGHVAVAGPTAEVAASLGVEAGDALIGGILTGRVAAHDVALHTTRLDHPAGALFVPLADVSLGTVMRLRVQARDVALAIGEPGRISIRNRLPGTVTAIAGRGAETVDVKVDVGGEALVARITGAAVADLGLEIGRPVVALIKATAFDRPAEG